MNLRIARISTAELTKVSSMFLQVFLTSYHLSLLNRMMLGLQNALTSVGAHGFVSPANAETTLAGMDDGQNRPSGGFGPAFFSRIVKRLGGYGRTSCMI